jgi:hypothetical protein
MKTKLTQTALIVLTLSITLAHAASAAADTLVRDPAPVRVARRLTVSGVFDLTFGSGGGGIPMGGVALSVNLAPWIALDVVGSTMGYVSSVSGGGKAYLLPGIASPYLYGRFGGYFLSVGHEVEGSVPFATVGGGLEISLHGGLNVFTELGAIALIDDGRTAWGGRFASGVGFRF